METRLQAEPFDAGAELGSFSARVAGAGAVVSFTGVVRDLASGDLTAMVIEHYPGMTEKALEEMRRTALARFSLTGARIVHRFGEMSPGEPIMMVLTAARHRADAFAAAEFLMDFLKSRAPFWKKEITPSGESWVEARDADEEALKRW